MRKGFKILVLLIILLIPAGIYIFLQMFGHNEFELPIYSENRTEAEKEAGILNFNGLYDINGLKVDNNSFADEIIVLEFVSSLSENKKQDYQIKRISDIFRNEKSIRIIRVFVNNNYSDTIPVEVPGHAERNLSLLFASDGDMNKMIQSVLPSDEVPGSPNGFNKILLLDTEHKIRGSYLIDDFEEIDRLILEVKILLKKEQHA